MHLRRSLSFKRSLLLPLLLSSLLFPVIACGHAEDRRVLVYAAASLRDVLTELGEEYETTNNVHVAFNWGGSIALANQIKRGAPGDVFISAGSGPMDDLEEAELLITDSRSTLARNSLVLVVASETDPSRSVEQILHDSSLISFADPSLAPAGVYAKESLDKIGLWQEIQEKVVLGANVRTTLAYVESSAVEAAMVYRTDALNGLDIQLAHELPPDSHSPILYPIAGLKDSRNRDEASLFMEYLKEESSLSRFRDYGFHVESQP